MSIVSYLLTVTTDCETCTYVSKSHCSSNNTFHPRIYTLYWSHSNACRSQCALTM